MPTYTYSYDFDEEGPDPWTSWMPTTVLSAAEGGGVRFHAPGNLDPNHLDGIGPIWLVSHLSIPAPGSPGVLVLRDATVSLQIRAHDFDPHGARLVWWVCSRLPNGTEDPNFPPGIAVTNWAYTALDLAPLLTSDWQTLSVTFSTNPADWTYAGNNQSLQGDLGTRYQFLDLDTTLSQVNATLHLVLLGASPDQMPTGFLDIHDITISTLQPATPLPGNALPPEYTSGLEDTPITGLLNGAGGPLTFTAVAGSAQHGSVVIDENTGAYTFTPEANYATGGDVRGPASFRYVTTDGVTTSAQKTVTITLHSMNDAPTARAVDESASGTQNTPIDGILMTGSDVDVGEKLGYRIVAGSSVHGSVSLDEVTGLYTFTPEVDYAGVASFQYVVTDGQLDSAPKTVNLTINPAGTPPSVPSWGEIEASFAAGNIDYAVHQIILRAFLTTDPYASYDLGLWLLPTSNGQYVTPNAALAAQYLQPALGIVADANLQLAALYTVGDGVPRDYVQARTLLSALPNDPEARYRLGLLEDLGFGAPRDAAAAAADFQFAAEHGHAVAMQTLGRRHLEGDGIPANAEEAYFWLRLGQRFGSGAGSNDLVSVWTNHNISQAEASLSAGEVATLEDWVANWTQGLTNALELATDEPSAALPSFVAGLRYTGTDSFTGTGNALNNIIRGGPSADVLQGLSGDDTIYGLGGANTLNGGAGNDVLDGSGGSGSQLAGGSGNDLYILDNSTDSVTELPNEGVDEVRTAAASHMLADNVENLTYTGAGAFAGTGNVLNNLIKGGAGNDTLNGGAGNDVLMGGAGNDVYIVDSSADQVTELANEGVDEVRIASASHTLSNNLENLTYTGAGNFTGTGNSLNNVLRGGAGNDALNGAAGDDVLIGNAGNDTLTGGTGKNVLIAGSGNDTLDGRGGTGNELLGGTGDDAYLIDASLDTLVEFVGEGVDEVRASLGTYWLRANFENLTYTGSGNFNGTGNELNNTIRGGAANDVLSGGAGNDVLLGFAGNDTLIVGGGRNTALGGAGNDVLDGRGGLASTLQGGTGDDTYIVDNTQDSIYEVSGQGTDTTSTSLASLTLRPNIENLTYTGTAAFTGVGNELNNVLRGASGNDSLTGAAGDDVLVGFAGNDTLVGGTGRNTLIAGAGNDVLDGRGATANELLGGTGNDVYLVDNASDSLIEFMGEGTDTVQTTLASYVLRSNFENLTYTGPGAFSGTGNELANVIQGGAGADVLNGAAGIDTLTGLGGDDVFIFDAADSVNGGAGSDMLRLGGAGATLDLTLVPDSQIIDVEAVDVTGTGNNGLTLALSDVLALSTTTNTLRVDGNIGDTVFATDASGWVAGPEQLVGYLTYTQAAATLLIDSDITRNF